VETRSTTHAYDQSSEEAFSAKSMMRRSYGGDVGISIPGRTLGGFLSVFWYCRSGGIKRGGARGCAAEYCTLWLALKLLEKSLFLEARRDHAVINPGKPPLQRKCAELMSFKAEKYYLLLFFCINLDPLLNHHKKLSVSSTHHVWQVYPIKF
jgi:hypothetical protein